MSFAGKYELVSSQYYDEYLKAAGVGILQRTVASKAKPVVEITENGNNYTLTTSTPTKQTVLKFTLGQEFDEDTIDDRKAKTTFTKDGNKLIQVQKIGGITATVTREFTGSEMKAVFSTGGVTSNCIYQKV